MHASPAAPWPWTLQGFRRVPAIPEAPPDAPPDEGELCHTNVLQRVLQGDEGRATKCRKGSTPSGGTPNGGSRPTYKQQEGQLERMLAMVNLLAQSMRTHVAKKATGSFGGCRRRPEAPSMPH